MGSGIDRRTWRSRRFRYGLAAVAACAAVGLAYAGFALANSVGVTLTGNGPQPGTVSVALGDTVMFTNSENVTHIVSSKPLSLTSPVIQSGGTYAYVVTKTGTWGYEVSDSAGKNRLKGSIVVATPGAVTLHASTASVQYGRPVVLRGTTPLPAYPVVIEEQVGRNWEALPNQVTPAADGSFSVTLTPKLQTGYRANVLSGAIVSETQTVSVLPVITLRPSARRVASGKSVRFTIHIVPAHSAKQLAVQEFFKTKKQWKRVASGAPSAAGTVSVSVLVHSGSASFRAATQGNTKGFGSAVSKHVVIVGVGPEPSHRKTHTKTGAKKKH